MRLSAIEYGACRTALTSLLSTSILSRVFLSMGLDRTISMTGVYYNKRSAQHRSPHPSRGLVVSDHVESSASTRDNVKLGVASISIQWFYRSL